MTASNLHGLNPAPQASHPKDLPDGSDTLCKNLQGAKLDFGLKKKQGVNQLKSLLTRLPNGEAVSKDRPAAEVYIAALFRKKALISVIWLVFIGSAGWALG